jgi:hypothetical protein
VFLQSSFHFARNVNYAATSDTSKISTEMMVDDEPLLDMDVNYAAPSYSPVYVGTIQSCNNEKTTHDVSFELNNEVEEPSVISSPISTEMLVDNKNLLDIDAASKTCNKKVNTKPSNLQTLQFVEHDAVVRSEMNSIFKTARYQSDESRSIIRCAKRNPLTEVLLAIYTTYHSPLSILLFSWLEHEDLVALMKTYQWMKPLMSYSFPLGIPELSLFPTTASRGRFRIVVKAIEEKPEHRPVASRFLEFRWQSTFEGRGKEITSGYFEMASKSLVRLFPECLKKHIVMIGTNDGARIFHRQHYHGAQNRIKLSTDHTPAVSSLYCLKK